MLVINILIHLLLILCLTITTQIGGIVYIISIVLTRSVKVKNQLYRFLTFSVLYLTTTFFIIPNIAPLFGREKITNNKFVDAQFFITILCNRNYVKPTLNNTLQHIGKELQKTYPTIQLLYLDANFPFFDNFPLLPHLSHSDGKKIDISFIYTLKSGKLTNKKPSVSGYGVFEAPTKNEHNQTLYCKQKGYWQYDFPKLLTFGTNNDLLFATKATKKLILLILQQTTTQKIFIEPHLKNRLLLKNPKIRFHGCKAVRHDDHIHLQIH